MYALIVSLKVKPERREEFLTAAAEDGRGSREDEPGCLRFDVLEDAADPDHFYFYEVYRDEAAFKAHGEAPHYQVWRAAVEAGVLAGPAQVTRCQTRFPTDAAWR
ncbi:MAG TPA: putative quinol monooxygenase [Thermomicrobiales bacterium]|nr:putative quinol monooxygenase [Thermomicrobiales bacterium]